MTEASWQLNGYKVKYIADDAAFIPAVADLGAADSLALDLEFDDNRYTYGLNLCLVQIATRETCYLIDPFLVKDLEPLYAIIRNPAIMKIIHSSSNDILLLKKLGCVPRNVLDTELVAKVLDYARTSFANMMAVMFAVEIDKSYQVSNWNIRPLVEEQLLYAANDVVYLHPLKDALMARVQELGRLEWVNEECRLLEQIEQKDQADRYSRMRGADRLNAYELFILKHLFEFRETLAIRYNKPSNSVIPNEVLINLALSPVDQFNSWQNTKGMMGRIKDNQTFKEYQRVLQAAQTQAQAERIPHERPARPRRPDFLVSREEAERRKASLQPVRARLMELYGENVATLLLPQGVIGEYAEGRPLQVRKKYAEVIVHQVLSEMNLPLQ